MPRGAPPGSLPSQAIGLRGTVLPYVVKWLPVVGNRVARHPVPFETALDALGIAVAILNTGVMAVWVEDDSGLVVIGHQRVIEHVTDQRR